jgi:dipeptidyl aminopeptidase/acylaminoacyl peptidase
VLVRRWPSGEREDVTPPPFDVRSRVHEYGGVAHAIAGRDVFFVHFPDQRLYRTRGGEPPRPFGPATPWRLADLVVDPLRPRLLAVGERHAPELAEPENAIVALDREDGGLEVLVRGADFYASPAPSPDGRQLAWLEWNHPHMPWDAAALHVAALDAGGRPLAATHVAGDAAASVFQPEWSPQGVLTFVFEPEGIWNLCRAGAGRARLVRRSGAEYGAPLWRLGTRTWGFVDERTVVAACRESGAARLEAIDVASGRAERLPLDAAAVAQLACGERRALVVAHWPDRPPSLVLLDLDGGPAGTLREAGTSALPPEYVSRAEPVEFATTGGRAETIERVHQAELAFYGRVFGFAPA